MIASVETSRGRHLSEPLTVVMTPPSDAARNVAGRPVVRRPRTRSPAYPPVASHQDEVVWVGGGDWRAAAGSGPMSPSMLGSGGGSFGPSAGPRRPTAVRGSAPARRARAWYSGPCLRGSAYSLGLIVQYVPDVVPYQDAPPQSGSNAPGRRRHTTSSRGSPFRRRRSPGVSPGRPGSVEGPAGPVDAVPVVDPPPFVEPEPFVDPEPGAPEGRLAGRLGPVRGPGLGRGRPPYARYVAPARSGSASQARRGAGPRTTGRVVISGPTIRS